LLLQRHQHSIKNGEKVQARVKACTHTYHALHYSVNQVFYVGQVTEDSTRPYSNFGGFRKGSNETNWRVNF
jgi:hypothetical protein